MVFLSIILLSGIPWWFISYTTFLKNPTSNIISVGVCFIAVLVLGFLSKHKMINIILATLVAHQIAFLIKVAIDCSVDASNHNLVPFEMVIFLFVDLFLGIIAAIIVSSLKK